MADQNPLDGLETFVVRAKAATYVGKGQSVAPSRAGSHDLAFADGPYAYTDSYFGATDFLGQETVWYLGQPIWAMNYYGRILHDDLINATEAAGVIRGALSAMYQEGRFLGGFRKKVGKFVYDDASKGDCRSFSGIERILLKNLKVYMLAYHGGLIRA